MIARRFAFCARCILGNRDTQSSISGFWIKISHTFSSKTFAKWCSSLSNGPKCYFYTFLNGGSEVRRICNCRRIAWTYLYGCLKSFEHNYISWGNSIIIELILYLCSYSFISYFFVHKYWLSDSWNNHALGDWEIQQISRYKLYCSY